MITHIKSVLLAAGCTQAIFESEQMTNTTIEPFAAAEIIGIVKEPDIVTFNTSGNGVTESFPPVTIEIVRQAATEDTAENNRVTFDFLRGVARKFIHEMIRSGRYQKIGNVTATKITEKKYDANVIGWSLPITLRPVSNLTNCL